MINFKYIKIYTMTIIINLCYWTLMVPTCQKVYGLTHLETQPNWEIQSDLS